jgi:uncharacterized protein YbaR (Trm112 family)
MQDAMSINCEVVMDNHSILEIAVCPNCKKRVTVIDVKFNAEGKIHFDMLCVLCGINLSFDTSWETMLLFCAQQEIIQKTVIPMVKTVQ